METSLPAGFQSGFLLLVEASVLRFRQRLRVPFHIGQPPIMPGEETAFFLRVVAQALCILSIKGNLLEEFLHVVGIETFKVGQNETPSPSLLGLPCALQFHRGYLHEGCT